MVAMRVMARAALMQICRRLVLEPAASSVGQQSLGSAKNAVMTRLWYTVLRCVVSFLSILHVSFRSLTVIQAHAVGDPGRDQKIPVKHHATL